MDFNELWAKIGSIPYTSQHRCKILYDLVAVNNLVDILELGVAYGKTTAVMAAGVQYALQGVPQGPTIHSIDLTKEKCRQWQDPNIEWPEDMLQRLGLDQYVSIWREHVSYNWWLIRRIEQLTRSRLRTCVPCYDLVFLDGSHNLYNDSGAFFMAEKLLRPGGFFLCDDLHWAHKGAMAGRVVWGSDVDEMSEKEKETPHVLMMWKYLIQQHPNLHGFVNLDNWWVMCQKK